MRDFPTRQKGTGWTSPSRPGAEIAFLLFLGCGLVSAGIPRASAQAASGTGQITPLANLPDAPLPQTEAKPPAQSSQPCREQNAARSSALADPARISPSSSFTRVQASTANCKHYPPYINWYVQVVKGPPFKQNGTEVQPLTVDEKGWLAAHNLLDPFNFITIAGEAAISVAANPHSDYGPGFPGWGRYIGVSFTQDMTGEFFDTFAIPSLTHQDPRYFRMPSASIKRRIFHAIAQAYWARGDNGKGMPNYGNLAGFAIDDAIGNLYVPGQRTDIHSSVDRYLVGLGTAPTGNFVVEFLPDVARRIHVQIVVVQRIINQVAHTGGPVEP